MNYMIAGAFSKFKELSLFLLKNNPQLNNNITVYDGINNCSWNGGRINRDIYYKDHMINFYYNRNINIALTFSNFEIDLNDIVGNQLLNKFHKDGNYIILINDDLRQYIRKNFPKYKLIYSITGLGELNIPMTNDDLKIYQKLEQVYDLIVPRMEHIFDKLFLTLNQSKYEIMLNDTCVWNCKYYKEHFEAIAKENTLYNQPWKNRFQECYNIEECWIKNFDSTITSSYDEMDISVIKHKELIDRGISNFKIMGRELNNNDYISELSKYFRSSL